MKNILKNLIVFVSLSTSFAVQAAPTQPFLKEDYPVLKLDFDISQAKSPEEIRIAIVKGLNAASGKLKDPWIRSQLSVLMAFVADRKLTSENQQITPDIKGFTAPFDTLFGIKGTAYTEVYGDDEMVTGYQIYITNKFGTVPLTTLVSAMHEIFGHLSQFMTIQSIFGAQQALTQLSDPVFFGLWARFSHLTAALLETQFYMAVPKSYLIDEIMASSATQSDKDFYVNFYEKIYTMTPREIIKFRSTSEACGGKPCISEKEYESYFQYFNSIGFDFL